MSTSKSSRFPVVLAVVASLALCCIVPAWAAVSDLPGMSTATSMREWLKLTDDQVAKLQPVIDTRIKKSDAALDKLDQAEQPDIEGFLAERKAYMDEFNGGVTKILTPDQLKQWESFKAEVEKTLVQEAADKRLAKLQPEMKMTDDQVGKIRPAMTKAMQGKMDVLQKLANTGRISLRDKKQAGGALKGINAELEKSMSAVCSPDQMTTYKAIVEAEKAARKKS